MTRICFRKLNTTYITWAFFNFRKNVQIP